MGARERIAAALFGLLALAGCDDDYTAADAPTYLTPAPTTPRLALVLGSGGPRGFAHIGVLKVLEAEGIRPDLIVGTSSGAVVGALYAAGLAAGEIERAALELGATDIADLGAIRGSLRGTGLQDLVNRAVGQRAIEALATPMIMVSTLRDSLHPVLFNRGNTGVAARASSAVPGSFQPVRIRGVEHVDGDLTHPVPIHIARQHGAQRVVAVDVSQNVDRAPPPDWAPPEWRAEAVARRRRIAAEAPGADVIIEPPLPYLVRFSVDYRKMAIAAGEAAARAALPRIRAAVNVAQGVTPTAH